MHCQARPVVPLNGPNILGTCGPSYPVSTAKRTFNTLRTVKTCLRETARLGGAQNALGIARTVGGGSGANRLADGRSTSR